MHIVGTPTEDRDLLFGVDVTLITWDDPLQVARDLTLTQLHGNLVPATQGRRHSETFTVSENAAGPYIPAQITRAVGQTNRRE